MTTPTDAAPTTAWRRETRMRTQLEYDILYGGMTIAPSHAFKMTAKVDDIERDRRQSYLRWMQTQRWYRGGSRRLKVKARRLLLNMEVARN